MPNKGDINPQTGQPYAVNPQTGQWDDNYWATVVEPQLKGGGFGGQSYGGGQQSFGGGSGDVLGLAQQIAGFGQQQQSGVVNSLSDRYKALLEQVGNQASRELGARGIPISSDMSQTFIRNRQGNDPSVLNAATMLNQQQNLPYQNAVEQAMSLAQMQQSQNQWQQQFDYQRQQDALNRQLQQQSLSGLSGGMGGGIGGGYTPTSPQPTASPGGAPRPTAGFTPVNTTQQAANNGFWSPTNQGAFSGNNLAYVGGQIGKAGSNVLNTATKIAQSTPQYKQASNLYNTAQNVYKSQPVQNVVKSVSNVGKNLASGATNLFKSFFG